MKATTPPSSSASSSSTGDARATPNPSLQHSRRRHRRAWISTTTGCMNVLAAGNFHPGLQPVRGGREPRQVHPAGSQSPFAAVAYPVCLSFRRRPVRALPACLRRGARCEAGRRQVQNVPQTPRRKPAASRRCSSTMAEGQRRFLFRLHRVPGRLIEKSWACRTSTGRGCPAIPRWRAVP